MSVPRPAPPGGGRGQARNKKKNSFNIMKLFSLKVPGDWFLSDKAGDNNHGLNFKNLKPLFSVEFSFLLNFREPIPGRRLSWEGDGLEE